MDDLELEVRDVQLTDLSPEVLSLRTVEEQWAQIARTKDISGSLM